MRNVNPIVAGVLDGEVNTNVHLEWVVNNDPTEVDGIIVCLSQVDRESIPGASILLDEKDIYINLEQFKRLCVYGLRIYKDMKQMIAMRQLDDHSELRKFLLSTDEDLYV
jgi:hypothetical protein